MMTTLADFRTRVAREVEATTVGSAVAGWSETTLTDWIIDAIRDYSERLPRAAYQQISCVAAQHDYDMPVGSRGAISVEYPEGEDPPDYLVQRASPDARFWQDSDLYTVREYHDATVPDVLTISASPLVTETIGLVYSVAHKLDVTDSDHLTVAADHEHLVLKGVMVHAWEQRLNAIGAELGGAGADKAHPDLAEMRRILTEGRLAYLHGMNKAVGARTKSTRRVWVMDDEVKFA